MDKEGFKKIEAAVPVELDGSSPAVVDAEKPNALKQLLKTIEGANNM